jgi:acyl-CoA thioesterase I
MRLFKTLLKLVLTLVITLVIAACADSSSTTATVTKPKKAAVIMIFGDSTSQGYGIEMLGTYYENVRPGTIYADLLINRLRDENMAEFAPITVVNASLGSEFTSQAIDRLPALLAAYRPTHVVLAHGTNDAGSGYPNSYIATNFTTMINMVKNSGAKALLADVTFTRYGIDYANAYSQMVFNTAVTTGATYVPILNGIAGNPAYYLEDGFHQNEAAQPFMLNNLWAKLIPLLD